MNLLQDKQRSEGGIAEAVDLGGSAQAASAQFTVGRPSFDDDWVQLTHSGWKTVTDRMAASIVRLEQALEEARAQLALYESEQRILQSERDEARKLAESAMFEADLLRSRVARMEAMK